MNSKNIYHIVLKYVLIFIGIIHISTFAINAQEKKYGTYYTFKDLPSNTPLIPLQALVDIAKPGDTIKLRPGIYEGPIVIKTNRLVIDGSGKCTVSGNDKGSVISIEADSVHIKNFVITNSGGSHDKIDAGVVIKGNHNIIENNRIQECLFGVDIFQSDHNKILHNEISSLSRREKALKGDAIRLWYSKHNLIKHNYWHHVRDMVVWYSSDTSFEENKGVGHRYSIHFMYAHNNKIYKNEFYGNSVGVFLMYSERTIMTENVIMKSQGVSGMCLGMKETSSNQILNNRFIYSAEGIHFDVSPYVPEKMNTIENNEIAFCGSGMFFHGNQTGNLIKQNYFHNNLSQVTAQGKTANGNIWENNYFDDYQGFDRDGDNIGDTPYRLYTYVEHLWNFNKNVKFFYGSPILVILDFLERLASFSEPKFVLKDDKPMFKWDNK